jgi:hypothetical protein
MVGALNHARGDRFAAGFTTRGRWYPFTRSLVRPLTGRADIMAFAIIRIGAGDEWKLGALGRLGRGRYTVRVTIVSNERRVGSGTTRVTVDCRSGLVASWIGPALEMPPVVDDD